MIDLTLQCNIRPIDLLRITATDSDKNVRFESENGNEPSFIFLSPDDARRLYDALGEHLGITPAAEPESEPEPDALTRIADVLDALNKRIEYEAAAAVGADLHRAALSATIEMAADTKRIADALTGLSSYATADGLPPVESNPSGSVIVVECPHGHRIYCPDGCGVVRDLLP